MLFVLLTIIFIAVIWGVGFVVNILVGGAANIAHRKLHERDRLRDGDGRP